MGARGKPTEAQTDILSGGADVLRYELLLDKGDHYFGGLVQKKVDAKPDHEGLAIFNELSVVFLHSVAKDDRRASQYLANLDVAAMTKGRAKVTRVETN